MLTLTRYAGQMFSILTPSGNVDVKVVELNRAENFASLEITATWRKWSEAPLLRPTESYSIVALAGLAEVYFLHWNYGHGLGASIGVKAPRDWTILRQELVAESAEGRG